MLAQVSHFLQQHFGLASVPERGMESVHVIHCFDAYGLVLKDGQDRWKVVYSGDTVPCPALIKAGANATLLIHEATLEDDMLEDAWNKKHSTMSQALQVGMDMNAERVLLTHFSQRYPKIPQISECSHGRACVAFDLLHMNFSDLKWLPVLTPYYPIAFPGEEEEVDYSRL